jgi:hypothetical protein
MVQGPDLDPAYRVLFRTQIHITAGTLGQSTIPFYLYVYNYGRYRTYRILLVGTMPWDRTELLDRYTYLGILGRRLPMVQVAPLWGASVVEVVALLSCSRLHLAVCAAASSIRRYIL